MTERVRCPVCDRQVSSNDINLHLDLQCPGAQPASIGGDSIKLESSQDERSQAGPSTPRRRSMNSEADFIVIADDTPVKKGSASYSSDGAEASKPRVAASASLSSQSKPVASIFGKRKKPDEPVEPAIDVKPTIAKRKPWAGVVPKKSKGDRVPKVNPLVAAQPLAEKSRPATLDGYIGQTDIVGPGSLLRARIEAGEGVGSCILWGPPGCGKTTLARLIAKTADADFKELSATSSGAADVRQVFEQARNGLQLTGRKTILMVDEIHRFTRPQQDLFLPYVENGWVQLIGATTENPSFKVNGALLSRCQVFTLSKHEPDALLQILTNALANHTSSSTNEPQASDRTPHLPPDLLPFLADVADGDARQALNGLELALKVCADPAPLQATIGEDGAIEKLGSEVEQQERDRRLMDAVRKGLRKGYDRTGEERYDMISAMHKCLRGSDGSAAMYWLARMITGGEDALYIARRLVVMASEDVGLADPHALPLAMATYQACQVIGLPECRINLAHCVAYLAEAPKSTRAYTAYKRAETLATQTPLPPIPLQIRNAPTQLMRKLGYGREYAYNPDYAHPVHNDYLPPTLQDQSSFSPHPSMHILRTVEGEEASKKWDLDKLERWEEEINEGERWEGRDRM